MSDTEVESLDALRQEFSRRFVVKEPRSYGRDRGPHQGYSDNALGVQWNTGLDRQRGAWTLGVNLEGMKYDGWPIARFIEAERARPELQALIEQLSRPGEIEIWLEREAWQVSARPPIAEYYIGPERPPVYLAALTTGMWLDMLAEAYNCLDPSRGHRGRARQMVTLSKAGSKEMDVAPHLQFKLVFWRGPTFSPSKMGGVLMTAREVLLPIYEFVRSKSAPPQGAIRPSVTAQHKDAPPILPPSSAAETASTVSRLKPGRPGRSPGGERGTRAGRSAAPKSMPSGNDHLPVASDPAATRRRIAALDQYMSSNVLGSNGFVCSSFAPCRGSHDGAFFEGQLHHVGQHYDVFLGDAPFRIRGRANLS